MTYKETDFVMILRENYYSNNSDILTNLGYNKDDSSSNEHVTVYIDHRINSVIVVVSGLDLNVFLKSNSIIDKLTIITLIIDKIITSQKSIDKVIEKYVDKDIIFLGHSLGGYSINVKLNNTKYICYTYNTALIHRKSSENIKNYRTNYDLISLPLIGNEAGTVKIDALEYFLDNKGSVLDFFKDVHETTIFTKLDNLSIPIQLPVFEFEEEKV